MRTGWSIRRSWRRRRSTDCAGHQHRLGPFDAETDPSKHDAAIIALAGAVWAQCERCRSSQVDAVADDTAVLVRLVELVARAYAGRHGGSLRELLRHGTTQWTADLAELSPADRAAALDRMSREARIGFTGHAASLLVGVWWLKQMAAEAPTHAANAIQRVRDQYDLPEADDGGIDPTWAWAHLHAARRSLADASPGSYTTVYTLRLAGTGTGTPTDEDHLLSPLTLEGPSPESEADLVLQALGWAPAWYQGRWKEVNNPATLHQDAWDRSDSRHFLRVRRGAPAPVDPVPYREDVRWPLESDRYYPYDDSTAGRPPGRVRYALRSIVRSENGERDQYLESMPFTEPDSAREHLTERTAEAHAIVEEFRQWLHDQLQNHGWPRAGADFENLALTVLAWVASDPDEHRRAGSAECLAAAVAAGHADPAHLDVFTGSGPMSSSELLEAVCRLYPDA